MDLSEATLALASSKQRILITRFADPAKAAANAILFTFLLCLTKDSINLCELFKIFILRISENRVCAVALLFFGIDILLLKFLVRLAITYLFDSKLHSANLEDIPLQNLVILNQKRV